MLTSRKGIVILIAGLAFCVGVWLGWMTESVMSAFGPCWLQDMIGDYHEWEWQTIHRWRDFNYD